MKTYKILILWLCLSLSFLFSKAQVKLSTNFSDTNSKKEKIHDAWQVANDISPKYDGPRDDAQIRPDMKMNVIRLSGGIKNGSQKDTGYDMVRWDNTAKDYVYNFNRLIRVIEKADQHGDEIYQLVIDNVPWAFQRGYTFVNLDKNNYNGTNFRSFEEIEQYGNALPPANMMEYGQYVEALMQTLIDKFGMNRVQKWRFRIGSEIESPGHWKGTAEDFIRYFDVSYKAMKKIIPDAHIGIHTREPRYVAVRTKGVNYKGEKFVSFHKEILEHAYKNNFTIDSWGLSYYIQFDKAGEYHVDKTWYNEWIADLVNHPRWNKNTEINLEEFKATASFRAPDGRFATLKSASSHGQVAHIALSNLFYKQPELNQIHRWLQYKNVKDEIANQELLKLVGKTRYETKVTGRPSNTSNTIDGIFTLDEKNNMYEALIYNYNANSTAYTSAQPVNLSVITNFPVGTRFQFRSSYYTKSHNKLQSFISEPYFQDSWYVNGIKEGQKLGEASRVLKSDIYNNRYKSYDGYLKYAPGQWVSITSKARSDGGKVGSELVIESTLHSFSFRKFEIRVAEPVVVNFTAPEVGERFNAPANIKVEATEANGRPLEEMRLFLDGQLVRIIKNPPYRWGYTNNTDPELFNLGAGDYTLRVTAKNSNGDIGERQISVRVQENNGSTIVHMTKYNAQSFALDGGNGGSNAQSVKLWSANTANVNQQWEEIPIGNGYYQYRKVNTNYCIDGGNGGTAGQLVKLWQCNSSNQNQHWQKVKQDDNVYRLQKRNAAAYSIDGMAGGENGRQTVLTTNRNSLNSSQAWLFRQVSNKINDGKEPNEITNEIQVFPNPAHDILHINVSAENLENGLISITNIAGKKVLEKGLYNKENQINVQHLQQGLYFITLKIGDATVFHKKLMKN